MTIPNSPEQKLIEDSNLVLEALNVGSESGFILAKEALPIACSLIAELAELREKAEALEWLIHRFPITFIGVDMIDDCPEILKQMIEQKERTSG